MKPDTLKIETLKGWKWCDRDMLILHACFQLLTDCVEKEKLLNGHVDWNRTPEDQEIKAEIETLYNWWKERKKEDDDCESRQYEEDNEMLIRLIKIRKHLWT